MDLDRKIRLPVDQLDEQRKDRSPASCRETAVANPGPWIATSHLAEGCPQNRTGSDGGFRVGEESFPNHLAGRQSDSPRLELAAAPWLGVETRLKLDRLHGSPRHPRPPLALGAVRIRAGASS